MNKQFKRGLLLGLSGSVVSLARALRSADAFSPLAAGLRAALEIRLAN